MTQKQAKSELEAIYMSLSEEKKKALDVAFKAMEQALEQEPAYCDRNICLRNEYNGIGCDECEVTKSQEPCEDAISRQAVLEMAYDMSEIDGEHFTEPHMVVDVEDIQKLSSVRPQEPKIGQWKMMYEPKNMAVCSECGKCAYLYNGRTSTWCPHCGNYKGE